MEIIGYTLALLIGITLGLIGSGGSILSVPILTYFFKMDAIQATSMSLFIVACTSWIGTNSYIRKGYVNYKNAIQFGIPSILAIITVRRWILPQIPEDLKLGVLGDVHRDTVLMIAFAILMLFSAIKMISNSKPKPSDLDKATIYIVLQGIVIGIVTGFLGAGGGFLIIPALVLILKMDIKSAIGTSLFIIAMNTSVGFISNMGIAPIQWPLMLTFTALAIVGILVGIYLNSRINATTLKPVFGWFILLIGATILLIESGLL